MKTKILLKNIRLLSWTVCLLWIGVNSLSAAPATLTQSVTNGGETITLQLTKQNLRGANFELWSQNSSGSYDVVTPVSERSYIGTVDEYPGAVSCGILLDSGEFKGAVYFDRGATWRTQGTAVVSTKALDYSTFTNFEYPTASSVLAGQAGSTMYGYELAVDVDYDYYNTTSSGSAATALEGIEYSICVIRAIFMRDALLRPYLGRIILRATLAHDPYTGFTELNFHSAVTTEWNTNQTDTDPDLVAGVSPVKIGGGLAWVGAVGANNGTSVSHAEGNGDFSTVLRHELGHNWGCNHYEGGKPEGAGIMGGNKPGRFSGCEVNKVLSQRDSKLSYLDSEGTFTTVNLPPYAALDPVELSIEMGKVELVTIDALENDFDANGHALTLDSYATTSNLGYPVTLSVGTGANGQDELVYSALGGSGFDYFSYTIKDSSGQTATGYVVINCKGVIPPMWVIETDADTYTKVNSSSNYGDSEDVVLKNFGTSSSYTRAGWIHFDISGKVFGDAASLEFTAEDHGGDAGYIDVWAIVDGQNGDELDVDWTELGLTTNNAPYNPDFVEGENTTYIGRFETPAYQSTFQVSTPELLAFLQADTNGEVTFLLLREEGEGANFSLRSKESPNGGAATLRTYYAGNQSLGTDTYVRNGSYANTNYGAEAEILIKKDGNSYQREAYLRFDHTAVNTIGLSATILTLTPTSVQPGQTYRLRLVDDAGDGWAEQGMTWNNRPISSGAGVTFLAADLTVGVPYSIDVTDLIAQGGNGNGAVTFHIDALTQISSGASGFASRENSTASYRPTLEIVNKDPHDAYVRGGSNADNNYGSAADLLLKNESSASYVREFYLRRAYDNTAGNTVTNATLTLTPTSAAAGRTIRVRLMDDADDSWLENTITWNNAPAGSGLEVTFSSDNLVIGQPYVIDVAALLNQANNTNGVASFHVDSPGFVSGAYNAFASKEHGTPSYHPVLSVQMTTPNSAPSASADTTVTDEDTDSVVTVLVNDSDVDGDSLTVQSVTQGANGSVSTNGTTVTYTPAADYNGSDSFTYTVSDGNGGTDTATVNVTVNAVNDAPVANDNSGSVAEDAAVGTAVAAVSATDADTGDSLSYAITGGNTAGAFVIDSNGNITTAATLDFETLASYSLTVTVTDSTALSDTASVIVTVIEVVEVTAPAISTGVASNLTSSQADIAYSVSDDGGEDPTVTLYYGESDGGTTPGAWTSSQAQGTQAAGGYSATISGLNAGTTYYFTLHASNSAGEAWGSSGSFTTEADASAKLVRTTVNNVSSTTWTTVDLGKDYTSAVIIATPIYVDSNVAPMVTRIRNVSGSSFDLKIDRADGQTGEVTADVSVIAVEEGVYTQAADGVTMEAVKFTSTVTARRSNWNAEARSFQNSYTSPVVVGQVMSYNDSNWSAFWSMGSSRLNPVDASNLNVGKHVAEDSNTTRANETVGYIVIESGSGTIDGVAFTAALGSDIVKGVGNTNTGYNYSLSGLSSASAAAVSMAAMDGNDGAWAVLYGATPITTSTLTIVCDEDQIGGSERKHTAEQVGYIVFE